MAIFDYIKGFLYAALAWLQGVFYGWKLKEQQDLAEEAKAHETRNRVEDDIHKSTFPDRRVRLGKWTVPGVEADKADKR